MKNLGVYSLLSMRICEENGLPGRWKRPPAEPDREGISGNDGEVNPTANHATAAQMHVGLLCHPK